MIEKSLVRKVHNWGASKGLHKKSNIFAQIGVMVEECAEYALDPSDPMEFGDVLVTMIQVGAITGVKMEWVMTQQREGDATLSHGVGTMLLESAANVQSAVRKNKSVEAALMYMYDVMLVLNSIYLKDSPQECLEMAYDKISKRAGAVINGSYVKTEDMKPLSLDTSTLAHLKGTIE